MKKLMKYFLCGLLAISTLTACAKNEEPKTVGGQIHQIFEEYVTSNKDASALDIADHIAANEILPFAGMSAEVEEGLLMGFENAEITGFEQAAVFGPMIGTIPFIGYIFVLPSDADVDGFVKNLKDHAMLNWNICTQADELTVEKNGNTVFFLMSPETFVE